jgi:hypothetical protein
MKKTWQNTAATARKLGSTFAFVWKQKATKRPRVEMARHGSFGYALAWSYQGSIQRSLRFPAGLFTNSSLTSLLPRT